MVNFPCVLKLDGDDELIYVNSEHDLLPECTSLIFHDNDRLIDSDGLQYIIQINNNEDLSLLTESKVLTTDEVTKLIQADQFAKAEVCLTKIQFKSVADAIKSLSA